MNNDFFPEHAAPDCPPARGSMELGQFFLPAWAAEELYDLHFGHLSSHDLLWEPAAGDGRMLAAVPADVPAFGTEIDPLLAAKARARTGRPVDCGDLRTIHLPDGITAVFGNPKFELALIDDLIRRIEFLPAGGKCGLVLPSYCTVSSRRILRWNRHFTLQQECLPRGLFAGLKHPLLFMSFVRCEHPRLIGFGLYREFRDIQRLPAESQSLLSARIAGPRSVWRELVNHALRKLGGEASLDAIYNTVGSSRPTDTPYWKEQIRKLVQDPRHYRRTARGRYALPLAA